jgi:hypothetical protein
MRLRYESRIIYLTTNCCAFILYVISAFSPILERRIGQTSRGRSFRWLGSDKLYLDDLFATNPCGIEEYFDQSIAPLSNPLYWITTISFTMIIVLSFNTMLAGLSSITLEISSFKTQFHVLIILFTIPVV